MTEKRKNIDKVPNLRFPEFSGEWEERKLKDIATFYSGGTPLTSKKEYFDGNIPFIRSGEINSYKTEQFISELGLKNSSAKMVEVGDVLYALYGATSGEVGISKIKGAINQAVLCIKTDNDQYFLASYLRYKKEDITKTYLQGGQGNLSAEIIKNLKISFPSIHEQKKIADFLFALDSKIQTQRKTIEELNVFKKGIAKKIFSQQLKFKDDYGNDFPEWKEIDLENVCEIKKGEQFNKEELDETGLYPCLNGGVSPSGFSEKYNTDENTITISEGGNSCGFINFMTTKFWLGGHCYKILLSQNINLLYFYQLLKYNEQKIMSLRVGSGLPNIQLKDLKRFKIKISLAESEQQKIANFLSSIDSKIDVENQILQKLEEQKKYFLANLFI